jgi:glucose/arabinose dehydrogenase
MNGNRLRTRTAVLVASLSVSLSTLIVAAPDVTGVAQVEGPTMLHPGLAVRTVVEGLVTPTSLAFLGADDILVLEKNTGRMRRVVGGQIQSTVLDLPVNFASERGLLGITLHPNYPQNPSVYLHWTESSTGEDTGVLSDTPLLGNRVDRYVWDGSTLSFAQNLIRLRALQQDANQPERGNHDGGVITFGPDQKLYILAGDAGRRGQLQNLPDGPFGPGQPDDQFGGPQPDDAHLTGVILRLNDDGSTPSDNPFFQVGARIGGQVGANIQKIYAYGLRNSFGMAFDPVSADLWEEENGDDSFTELNRVELGFNSGWVQIQGPPERIAQYKAIETSTAVDPVTGTAYFGLQQVRWPPTNIADSPEQALSRLFTLPGARYSAPEFSWRFEVAPGAIGFVAGRGLGPQFDGDLFVGGARTFLAGGPLFHFNLTGNRRQIGVDDPRLADRVADNNHKFDLTESESLLIGTNFGIVTDIETGPNGNLFLVSLDQGAIHEISRR